MSADRDLINGLNKRKRLRAKEFQIDSVELSDCDGNTPLDAKVSSPEDEILMKIDSETAMRNVVTKFENPIDIKVLGLILSGERDTEVFAAAMNIVSSPTQKKRREVKRCKDRIKKVIQRLGEKILDGQNEQKER